MEQRGAPYMERKATQVALSHRPARAALPLSHARSPSKREHVCSDSQLTPHTLTVLSQDSCKHMPPLLKTHSSVHK